jgi:hypothetical protein
MEREFNIICYSKWRFALMLISSWLSVFPIVLIFFHLGMWGQIVMGIYAIIIALVPYFILPKYIAKGLIKFTINTEGFQFKWMKPYWGSQIKQTLKYKLEELKSYKYEASYNFSTFKIKLKSGEQLKVHRWHNDSNDDFNKFMTHFRRAIEDYNKKKSTVRAIEKEKSIMENRSFLITIGLVIGLIFITTILLLIFKGVSNIKGIIPVLIVLGPLIWVVIRIIKGLQNTKIE